MTTLESSPVIVVPPSLPHPLHHRLRAGGYKKTPVMTAKAKALCVGLLIIAVALAVEYSRHWIFQDGELQKHPIREGCYYRWLAWDDDREDYYWSFPIFVEKVWKNKRGTDLVRFVTQVPWGMGYSRETVTRRLDEMEKYDELFFYRRADDMTPEAMRGELTDDEL